MTPRAQTLFVVPDGVNILLERVVPQHIALSLPPRLPISCLISMQGHLQWWSRGPSACMHHIECAAHALLAPTSQSCTQPALSQTFRRPCRVQRNRHHVSVFLCQPTFMFVNCSGSHSQHMRQDAPGQKLFLLMCLCYGCSIHSAGVCLCGLLHMLRAA